jgi:hypothetical protein
MPYRSALLGPMAGGLPCRAKIGRLLVKTLSCVWTLSKALNKGRGGTMDEERERLTLETIEDGALVEQFNNALDRVFENLADINTTKKAREVKLIVKIIPSDDRSFLEISGGVSTKTSGQQPIKTTADLSNDDRRRPVAYKRKQEQIELPFNVTRLNGKEGGPVQ